MEIKCVRCGQLKEAHESNTHLCVDCVKAENNRVSFYRQHNYNWIDAAKEADLNIWERQPNETDREYQVWLAYRDAYPSVRPSYRTVAEQLGTTVNVVKKVGQRWSFVARLQAWAKHCDEITTAQRKQEILDMNKKHISMADKLNEKLSTAIDNIDAYSLKPSEIQGLLKLSAELERKIRIEDTVDTSTALMLDDSNPEIKKSPTKTEDLTEVLDILSKAGLLGGTIGVKKTTTTEIVVKED